MSGPSAPQQANGASGRPVRAPPVVSLAARAAAGPDSLTKGHGSGARAVTALGGVTVAFAAAAQASAWPIWLLIGLIVAFAAVALLNTALMTTAGRHVELTLVRLIGGTRQQAWRIIAWEALITTLVGLAVGAVIARIAVQTPLGQPRWHIAIPPMLPAQSWPPPACSAWPVPSPRRPRPACPASGRVRPWPVKPYTSSGEAHDQEHDQDLPGRGDG